jgi:hypothetical protein
MLGLAKSPRSLFDCTEKTGRFNLAILFGFFRNESREEPTAPPPMN